MKLRSIVLAVAVAVVAIFSQSASAQLYEITSRIPQLIQPALMGGAGYKGFLEAGYSKTTGAYNADFVEFSTSQGFRYSSWFYMGVGLGVDILNSHVSDQWGDGWQNNGGFDYDHSSTRRAVMMPLFTDFRATLGNSQIASFFIDLKLGCSFLLSNKYIEIGNGYLTNQQYFYLRPSVGVRIPVSQKYPKQAIDLAVNYKLLTSNYWNRNSYDITLNAFGVSAAFEW